MAVTSRRYRETPVIPRSIWSPMYTLISLMMIVEKNAELFEQAFYEKKNMDPSMHAHVAGKTVELPTDVDAELLAKVLSNPEMEQFATDTLRQIDEKRYDAELIELGVTPIKKWSCEEPIVKRKDI